MLPSSKGDVTMSRINRRAMMLVCQAALICCFAFPWDDPLDQYFQRKNSVTLSAGNAAAVNSATHTIDPWPRYVGNTRIPGNGERMAGAVERYRDVSKIPRTPRPILPAYSSTTGIAVGTQ
jgi:hypothetical protein